MLNDAASALIKAIPALRLKLQACLPVKGNECGPCTVVYSQVPRTGFGSFQALNNHVVDSIKLSLISYSFLHNKTFFKTSY